MCGIFCLLSLKKTLKNYDIDQYVANVAKNMIHRGPDKTGYEYISRNDLNILLIHNRLRINGDQSPQPIESKDKLVSLIINGEIFNWKELAVELEYNCTQSDCEIILPLYEKYKDTGMLDEALRKLEGQFSFVLYDKRNDHIFIARDRIGVTPLYIAHNTSQTCAAISSELKCLIQTECNIVKVFYPRKFFYGTVNKLLANECLSEYLNFFTDINISEFRACEEPNIRTNIKDLVSNAVLMQLNDLITNDLEVDFGVLLSGGLDSSIIASQIVAHSKNMGYTKKIKTFSIGVHSNVPDLIAARKVASFLGTDHHEFYFSVEESIRFIPSVIWHIESYDCTTVRASTAMFLLSKKIKKMYPYMKVLFSGELSDELLCYLYGANAPSDKAFQQETINLVSNVHLFDCLRANKTCMAHSMEVRVPFTDSKYVNYILSLHPKWKMFGKNGRIEKKILRDSFTGCLPDDILYRKKEQFSDGVSGFDGVKDNLIDGIKGYAETLYTYSAFNVEKMKYTYNRPDTKEKLYYRNIFFKLFNNTSYKNTSELTVKQWTPKWSSVLDPSGRSQTFWIKN
jgi:asparagine synthase (glutamine-hydrolysing)